MPSIPLGQTELALNVGSHSQNAPEILKVVRYTATQVVCTKAGLASELRFRLKDGRRVGGRSSSRVTTVTPETLERIKWRNEEYRVRVLACTIAELASKVANKDRRQLDANAVFRQKAKLMGVKLDLEELMKGTE